MLQAKFYLKSILSEAQEQGYLLKNPANKLNLRERSKLRTTL